MGTTLGIEAIAEFSLLTNTYSAQFGGNGAVVNAVSRSGSFPSGKTTGIAFRHMIWRNAMPSGWRAGSLRTATAFPSASCP